VVQFLSAEWVHALDDAATRSGIDGIGLDGLVVAYDVDGFGYHVTFGPDGVRVREGATPDATVTIHSDRATATAVARGELSAQRAFMTGRLRLGGDATALVRAQAAVATLPDLFEAVRPETEW
jgi:putative sterol carrier protein